jgi:hypothetical protein
MRKLSMKLAFILLVAIFFAGCEKENNKGTIKLSITDAPIDSDGIAAVFITITDVQYQLNDSGFTSFDGFESPKSFNLLDLNRGVSELLGNLEIEAGTYSQLRFMLDAPATGANTQANPGCYLEFEDGTTQSLFVPSGAQTGYKGVGEFTVPSNGMVEITADFDVRKMVVKAGASGKYILKPAIRLIVDNQAGKIVGNVSNVPENTQIVVFAYESGTYTENESSEPEAETPRFPNAVSSDKVDELGIYHIDFLAPMAYDLVVVANVDGVFSEVLGIVKDVVVASKTTTTSDLDLSNF